MFIDQNYLKRILHYDPETGIFTWMENRVNVRKGDRAGSNLRKDGSWYRHIKIDQIIYYEHRLAFLYMNGYMPEEVDHDNLKKYDNKFSNLRESDRHRNNFNKTLQSNNKSGLSGVCFTNKNKWKVNIGNAIIGYFDDYFNAVCARKSAEVKYIHY